MAGLKKKDAVICFQETHFISKDYHRQSQSTEVSLASKRELRTHCAPVLVYAK